MQYILDAAGKALPFKVNILRLDGGKIAGRILSEKVNAQADVVFGLNQLSMAQLKLNGVLEAYNPTWTKGLPEAFQDTEHYFHSFWQTPVILVYNADVLSADQAPQGWLDLAKPGYKKKFAIGSTDWQTTRTYLFGMLWRFYDQSSKNITPKGWEFLKQAYANSVPFPGNEINNLVASGEIPIMLNWYGGAVRAASQFNINLQYVDTEGGTPMITESIALIKGRNNTANAKTFINWFGSMELQEKLAQYLGKAPALPEAMAKAPLETQTSIAQFTVQNVDWGEIAKHIDSWLSKIELEIIP